MFGHGHQMEREFSARSLSSRTGSELGSRHTNESGIYMTSFAATIFISALVTIGVSLISLIITLMAMLKSCESKSAGIVETWRSSNDYSYCPIFALNAELNDLAVDSLPAICKDVAAQYIKQGQYKRDLNITVRMAEKYFSSLNPPDDDLDVVLIDIDDLLVSDFYCTDVRLRARFNMHGCNDCIKEATHLKHMFFTKLYMELQAAGWPLILISRKPEKLRNATIECLISAGCGGWSSLIMRSDDEMPMDSFEYFTRRRTVMQNEGFRIMAVISNRMDALTGPHLGNRVFKLPNPIYYKTERSTESGTLPQQNFAI